MSLKSTFLAFKKSCTSCPNWGEGGGGGGGEGGNQVGILIFSAHTQFSSLILAGGRLTRLTRLPAWRV